MGLAVFTAVLATTATTTTTNTKDKLQSFLFGYDRDLISLVNENASLAKKYELGSY